ncbi:hypothetical protein L1987_77716 [Smallanthus sonchifolius]|uniref:Uncharacterized protein n=1 Tax=Smallanthus sonchifolius TaxID=185202 RepID=A0ACB8ZAI4_9ASTR|nr:hypothetical protein L1987_77716 [Smallanthus sonchifolius]
MQASAGLVAGSHNRNELIVIHGHEEHKPLKDMTCQVCEICGDEIGLTVDGDLFVACNECGFPVCRPCYEYERREGSQNCPQCKTRYKRLKGSPRVEGDDDEEDVDDIEHEFNIDDEQNKNSNIAESMLHGKMSYGRGPDDDDDDDDDDDGNAQYQPTIAGRSAHVSDEFPISSQPHGEQMLSSLHKRVHPYGWLEFGSGRWDEKKDGVWKERMDDWKMQQGNLGAEFDDSVDPDMAMLDEARQPLSRKVPIASSKINPYRMVIVAQLFILAIFLRYRLMNPVHDAFGLWLTSVICEIWFAISWILDQFPKWFPIERETYLDRLSLRYEREGEPNMLCPVDVFVSTVDPLKEPPLVTANTILSILAMDYPVDKISCYISDEGASMLTFESLSETAEFARKWVPFCKKFTRATSTRDREYEEFKVRINALVAKAMKVPAEGWIMQDGTPWSGNNTKDHPGMIQVFLGQNGGTDLEGNELPRLVYVSREKRPGFQHHKKAGAMNALQGCARGNVFLNGSTDWKKGLLCSISTKINMKGLDGIQGPVYVGTGCVFRRQALYGYDPPKGPKRPKMVSCDCCPCFGRRKKNPKYKNHGSGGNVENIQGYDDDKELMKSQMNFESKFGQSAIFVTSTLMVDGGVPPSSSAASLLKESIHVISCGYEDKTEWGLELGWIYGSITEDILTGFKMHCRGWRSIYCMPKRPAFKGSAPINLSDRLNQVLRWALGSVEIFFSRHSPLLYGYKRGNLKWLKRFAYVNTTVYPFTSIPLLAYCTLPAICLLTGKFIMPEISTLASLFFISLFLSIFTAGILELRWSGVSIEEWWRNEQFWVIGGVSAHLFAVIQGLLKVLAGIDTNFTVTSKASDDEDFGELYPFKWTTLLIPPTTILIINMVGVVAGVSDAINNGYQS